MQTFLPYEDFRASARVLDPSRLGNQFYREGITLIRGGWPNHPASRMWRGYDWALGCYLLACWDELRVRGKHYPRQFNEVCWVMNMASHQELPWFIGNETFHASHRAALLRKNPEWYGRFGWDEDPDPMPNGKFSYWWPV